MKKSAFEPFKFGQAKTSRPIAFPSGLVKPSGTAAAAGKPGAKRAAGVNFLMRENAAPKK